MWLHLDTGRQTYTRSVRRQQYAVCEKCSLLCVIFCVLHGVMHPAGLRPPGGFTQAMMVPAASVEAMLILSCYSPAGQCCRCMCLPTWAWAHYLHAHSKQTNSIPGTAEMATPNIEQCDLCAHLVCCSSESRSLSSESRSVENQGRVCGATGWGSRVGALLNSDCLASSQYTCMLAWRVLHFGYAQQIQH